MLEITCSGTPHEIGHTHGSLAKAAIHRTLTFYTAKFATNCALTWPAVRDLAQTFEPYLAQNFPSYLEEIAGVAQGCGLEMVDVLALNVRTEIAFGGFSDGCTALGWKESGSGVSGGGRGEEKGGKSWLAQNWDWEEEQKGQLVLMTIEQEGKPTIKMITEAGLIGKIGFNEAGVGVCLNAIKAKGMDTQRLPCHLALRYVLESTSLRAALAGLERVGVASSCHFLVADGEECVGLEWSSKGLRKVEMDGRGRVFHTNHFLEVHGEGVVDTNWLPDSNGRVARIRVLCDGMEEELTVEGIGKLFEDEEGFPSAICRAEEGKSDFATLFNIVMELEGKRAVVKVGRPIKPEEVLELSF